MNFQELRNLQEAYMEVYELDEVLDTPQKTQSYAAKNAASAVGAFVRGDTKTLSKRFEGSKRGMKKIEKRKEQQEQTDIYDIILSHLLDEGYADTPEAAEAIMVNMSEDWRESICEEYKKLPVGKMMWKAVNRTEKEADTRADRESEEGTYYYNPNNKQRQEHERAQRDKEKNNKMIRVADTHSKKEAKAKSKFKK